MLQPIAKLCGFKNQQDIDLASSLGAGFIGFVFWEKSKRFITREEFSNINLKYIQSKIVAVFSNPSIDEIQAVLATNRVDFIQLHNCDNKIGFEISKIRPIIWAFSGEKFTVNDFGNANFAQYFLFDSQNAGSGVERSFAFAKDIPQLTKKLFFLAGGINIENYKNALQYSNMIDVSSGIEVISGIKDEQKIRDFLAKIKNGN